MTPALLLEAADTLAGDGEADLLDLLAIHLGRPLGIRPGSWRAQRSATLAKLAKTFKPPAGTEGNHPGRAPRHV